MIFIRAAWQGLYVLEEATFSQQETKSEWSSQMQVHSNRKALFTLKREQRAKQAEAVYFHLSLPPLPTFSLPQRCAIKFIRGPKRCPLSSTELRCLLLKVWGAALLCSLCAVRAGCLQFLPNPSFLLTQPQASLESGWTGLSCGHCCVRSGMRLWKKEHCAWFKQEKKAACLNIVL